MRNKITNHSHQIAVLLAAAFVLVAITSTNVIAHELDQTSRVIWPDIVQSWSPTQMIAVVELSDDLTQGTFIKNLVSDNFAVPSTITGFGNCIYTINTHFFELIAEGGDPTLVRSEVVKLYK